MDQLARQVLSIIGAVWAIATFGFATLFYGMGSLLPSDPGPDFLRYLTNAGLILGGFAIIAFAGFVGVRAVSQYDD